MKILSVSHLMKGGVILDIVAVGIESMAILIHSI